jgi:serine/threonine protein kinase HipA of HipAB toxin-antitoxin module
LGLVGHRQADLTASVENEWLCMNLLAEFGLPVARTAILQFGGQKVLGVERFDRKTHSSGKWIMRLPQEDFCQALERSAIAIDAVAKRLPTGFPERVAATIFQGVARSARQLAAMPRT